MVELYLQKAHRLRLALLVLGKSLCEFVVNVRCIQGVGDLLLSRRMMHTILHEIKDGLYLTVIILTRVLINELS